MRHVFTEDSHTGERGAVSIKFVLSMALILIVAFVLIKVAPVYVEQRQITFKVDELANKISVRMPKQEDVDKSIERLTKECELPAGSIVLTAFQQNAAQITVGYTRNIDLLFTTYAWKVDYTAKGKAL